MMDCPKLMGINVFWKICDIFASNTASLIKTLRPVERLEEFAFIIGCYEGSKSFQNEKELMGARETILKLAGLLKNAFKHFV